MIHHQPLCNDDLLREMLYSDTDSQCDPALLEHIETCSRCQQRLDELAADGLEWTRAVDVLSSNARAATGELGDPSPASMSIRPVVWTESMAKDLLSPPSHPEMLGRIGRYEVERLIGSGGMGVVFRVHDTELNRPVAVKLLAPYLASSGSARKRFAREARAAAGVVDDHVVPIHNVESENEPPFLVMQYVAGGSLQEKLDRHGPLEVAEVVRIGLQVAKGLAAAHAQGLIHRDVKPSNILLDEGVERALLTDFGLARTESDACLTRSGFHPGTPHYMSPEQVRGEVIDGRSDLFGLGCVLYAACTGHPPFRAESSYAVLRRITDDRPRPLREINSNIPDWLEAFVMKLLSKNRDDRFDSAAEVAALLEGCLAHVQDPTTTVLPLPVAELAKRLGSRDADSKRKESSGFRNPSIRTRIAAAALAFMSVVGAIIFLETNIGTIRIESNSDVDVPITIRKGDRVVQQLIVSQQGASSQVKVGKYIIEIDDEDAQFSITNHEVQLTRGSTWIAKIKTVPLTGHQSGISAAGSTINASRSDAEVISSARELEQSIRKIGAELNHGRMELGIEYWASWPTGEGKRETITSLGTASWLQQPGMIRIDCDRMVPKTNSVRLSQERWTTGTDGDRTYTWNRVTNSIRYGTIRNEALAFAPNLFFWGRSATAYAHSMFGTNAGVERVGRLGHLEWDVTVHDDQQGVSIKYIGLNASRSYLPSRVESYAGDQLRGLIEFDDYFEPRPGIWAARTIQWTFYSDPDPQGNRVVSSRTKFTVKRLEFGVEAKIDDLEFQIPSRHVKDIHQLHAQNRITAPDDDADGEVKTRSYEVADFLNTDGRISREVQYSTLVALIRQFSEASVSIDYWPFLDHFTVRGADSAHDQIVDTLKQLRLCKHQVRRMMSLNAEIERIQAELSDIPDAERTSERSKFLQQKIDVAMVTRSEKIRVFQFALAKLRDEQAKPEPADVQSIRQVVSPDHEHTNEEDNADPFHIGAILKAADARRIPTYFAYGFEVTKVVPDSPAQQAGIEVGDVLLAWEGNHFYSKVPGPKLLVSAAATRELRQAVERVQQVQQAPTADDHFTMKFAVLDHRSGEVVEVSTAWGLANGSTKDFGLRVIRERKNERRWPNPPGKNGENYDQRL